MVAVVVVVVVVLMVTIPTPICLQATKARTELLVLNQQHQQRVEHIQHRLSDAKHRNTLLQQKLIAQETFSRDQMKTTRADYEGKIHALGVQLKTSQASLESNTEIQSILGTVQAVPSEVQYKRLSGIAPGQMDATQLVQVHMYETCLPIQRHLRECEGQLADISAKHTDLQAEHAAATHQRDHFQQALAKVKREDGRIAQLEQAELRIQVLMQELALARDDAADLQARLAVSEEERSALDSGVASERQQLELLKMDKEHLTLTNRDLASQDAQRRSQVADLQETVRELSKSREDSYEKLLKAKEEQTAEFERKVHARVQSMQEQNRLQLDKLHRDTKEMYAQSQKSPLPAFFPKWLASKIWI